jgi:hypothetical protein
VELPRPFLKLGPTGRFNLCPFTMHVQNTAWLLGPIFYRLLYVAVRGEHDFSPHLLFSAFDALGLTPPLLEEEHSPTHEEVVGCEAEVTWLDQIGGS